MTISIQNPLVDIKLEPPTNLKITNTRANKTGLLVHKLATPVALYGLDDYRDFLIGGSGNDSLNGGSGNDELWAGEGNDTLEGGAGNDTLVGGGGDDVYFVDHTKDIVLEYKDKGYDTVISSVDFRSIGNIERIVLEGSAKSIQAHIGDEELFGNQEDNSINAYSGNDSLFGGAGKDTLLGDHGNDILVGGAGNDSLVGGAGNDIFVFGSGLPFADADLGIDTIRDFAPNADKLALSSATFTGLSDGITFENVASQDLADKSSARLVYVRNLGALYYNENGASEGFGTGGQLATLKANLSSLSGDNFIFSDNLSI